MEKNRNTIGKIRDMGALNAEGNITKTIIPLRGCSYVIINKIFQVCPQKKITIYNQNTVNAV